MEIELSVVEARVIAALVEKERTTPEYYPLSLNALTNACNQKSNRHPVTNFDERTVLRAIESLRNQNLAMMVTGTGSRVAKYKHTFTRRFQLSDREVAVLCVLMLRGPQTIGEIRVRSNRLYDFQELSEVSDTLEALKKRGEGAYVVQLPRQPGRKEARYAHLLSGEVEIDAESPEAQIEAIDNSRDDLDLLQLKEEIDGLKSEMQELRQLFNEFKQQFE